LFSMLPSFGSRFPNGVEMPFLGISSHNCSRACFSRSSCSRSSCSSLSYASICHLRQVTCMTYSCGQSLRHFSATCLATVALSAVWATLKPMPSHKPKPICNSFFMTLSFHLLVVALDELSQHHKNTPLRVLPWFHLPHTVPQSSAAPLHPKQVPNTVPRAFARLMPSSQRARINCRSN
jgi:hypothetical protein